MHYLIRKVYIIDLHRYSIGGFEWISINLSKSVVFSLQTLENYLNLSYN